MTTMSNANIILHESIELMKAGIIGTTGRTVTMIVKVNGKDEKITIQEPEAIHTFQDWKARGFYVMKGQKAVASFMIWNYTEGKKADTDTEGPAKGYYYMKKASFFKQSQVAPINGPEDPDPEAKKDPAPVKEAKPAAGKKATKTDTQKAFETIEKAAAKATYVFGSGSFEGITYITDGFQLMKTSENVTEKALEKFDADKYINIIKGLDPKVSGRLDLTAKEIRAAIKEAKAGRRNVKVAYSNGEGLVLNANYLLNAVIATGATEYRYTDHKSPVVFENDSTFYMILPINYKNNNKPEAVKEKGFFVM